MKFPASLEAYWEQGWEGSFLCMFHPDGTTALDDLIQVANGHRLTVLDADGNPAWSGVIRFRKRRWWDRAPRGCGMWATSKPRGVRYADWITWFWKGPTKATLRLE